MDFDRKVEIITVSKTGKRRQKLKRLGDLEILYNGRLFTIERAYNYIQSITFEEDDKERLESLNLTKEIEIALFELYFDYKIISYKEYTILISYLNTDRFVIRHNMTREEIKNFIVEQKNILKLLKSRKENKKWLKNNTKNF